LEKDQKIRVLTHRSVTAVKGTKAVTELVLQNTRTQETETFPVNAVFVGIGQSPVTEFLEEKLELNETGFIVTDGMLRTSVPGVFAAGDVRDTPLRQIITAAADGALAAESAGQYVRMNSTK
jgi:thioredoxin reductase (NADPH)